jgi:hypothetical protein
MHETVCARVQGNLVQVYAQEVQFNHIYIKEAWKKHGDLADLSANIVETALLADCMPFEVIFVSTTHVPRKLAWKKKTVRRRRRI